MNRCICACGAAAVFAGAVSGSTVIDTYPDWEGSVTSGWLKVAQSFTAPADNILKNWMFAVDPQGGQTQILFEVYAWDDNVGPVGGPLFSSIEPWPVFGGDVLVSNINLPLVTGNLYGAVVDLLGYSDSSVHFQGNQNSYADGDASWWYNGWYYLNSGWNTKFRAEFVPAPGAAAILGLGGLVAARRRRV